MKLLAFDIETDGFLDTVTRVHSLVIRDVGTGQVWSLHNQNTDYSTQNVADGLKLLMEADQIIGHNIIKYDIPVLQKLYPWFSYDPRKVFDTLVASRLIWPNVADTDLTRIRSGKSNMPMKLAGKHSLDSWGHRLGNWKGDYAEMMEARGLDPWASWSEEMQDYCVQDVAVTVDLFNLIVGKNYAQTSLDLEHELAFIMAEMERNGFGFDEKAAAQLYHELSVKREELTQSLRNLFEPWQAKNGKPFVPKRDNAKLGYKVGVPVQKYKTVIFNPGSRDQIADRLITLRGWKPVQFTPSGKPKVDEDTLSELPWDEAKQLADFMLLQKRIGQIAEGDQAWLKCVTKHGNIHGGINPNGAVTGRATHFYPNIAQVPKVGTLYGAECRALFRPTRRGWVQLGCDVSGLELRMLGHFMAKFDGGAYGREVINGDIHTLNQTAAGLPTRDNAKTFIYAFLYGAGDQKIGSIIGKGRLAGRKIKQKFFKQVPALRKLIEGVQAAAASKGHLKGLDGRLLHVRSSHAALNTLLQSAGALVCKRWIIEFNQLLIENGLHNMVHIMAWVHDELQLEIHPSLVSEGKSIVGELCIKAIERAGEHFAIRVPLTGEYKIGNNWKDCH